ncbi:MAG: hypothetical protein JW915_05800 [Chitinispirillaceae bacterium]|nr:hypothetical protein [Chitinispirillaceae bacterium]
MKIISFKTHGSIRSFYALQLLLCVAIVFIGCKEKEVNYSELANKPLNPPVEIDPKLRPKTVKIKDVSRIILARKTGVEDEEKKHEEYEIVLRDTDGRNEQVLAKRFFFRFTDFDLLYMPERDAILYVGKPRIGIEEGIWLYNYKNDTDTLLYDPDIGSGNLTFTTDRKKLFFICGGEWNTLDLTTKEKRLYYQPKTGSRNGSGINPEGTLVAGCTDEGIFVEEVKTGKRHEWPVGDSAFSMGRVVLSENLKHVCYSTWNTKTGDFKIFYADLNIGKELKQVELSKWPGAGYSDVERVSNDGKYYYEAFYEATTRINMQTGKQEVLPFLGDLCPFHFIEENIR